jgi:hypothetical protein
MYTFVDFTSQIAGPRGSLVPQTRGSHTPIWCGLAVTLKIDYYYYYYIVKERSSETHSPLAKGKKKLLSNSMHYKQACHM